MIFCRGSHAANRSRVPLSFPYEIQGVDTAVRDIRNRATTPQHNDRKDTRGHSVSAQTARPKNEKFKKT